MSAGLDDVHVRHINDLRSRSATIDEVGLRLGDTYVMFAAEAALMAEHARRLVADRPGARVLEVGLGLGVFAEQLAAFRPGGYTAVEPHPGVADLIGPRLKDRLACPVTVRVEPWQSLVLPPASVDAIMYDTWPPAGHADPDFAMFVERVAVPVLRTGGRFSFFHSGCDLPLPRADVLDRFFPGWTAGPFALLPERLPAAWTKSTSDFLVVIAEKGAH